MQVRVDINGERHERDVPGELTLASLLRDDLGLTGTKVACGEGTCGSCTVLLDGRAVLSCLTLVAAIDGAEVRTVESDGELLRRLRRAFTANDGFQCGFCTPGQLMSALALLETHAVAVARADRRRDERQPLPLRRVRGHRRRCHGGGRVSPRLIKTEAVVEGRVEERWTLVEDDATPEYDDANPPAVIGTPTPRVTAKARLDGSARYTSDIKLPAQLEAAVLRSPHANAKLTAIDVEAARAVPGVRCVVTADDDLPDYDGSTLLTAEPGYAGAAVAAVAAESAEAADAALVALAPQWEELGFIVDMDVAADAQHFLEDPTEYERGDVDAALEGAAHVVEAEYRVPAQLHNSMEPHCAVAEWRGEDLTIWSSTQAIYEGRAELARAFGIPAERVRVICEFMGGGFGSKFGVGPEGILAATLAKRSRHPVRLVYSRREENLTAGYRTEARAELRVGADADGTLRGIEASVVMGLGSDGWTYPILEPMKAVYKCDNVRGFVLPVAQNLGPTAAFRAPGVMEGTFMLETRARRARRRTGDRSAGASPHQLRRGRSAGRQAVQLEEPAGLLRPGRRAGRLGRSRRPPLGGIAFAAGWGWRRRSGGAVAGRPRTPRCGSAATPVPCSRSACRIWAPASPPPAR